MSSPRSRGGSEDSDADWEWVHADPAHADPAPGHIVSARLGSEEYRLGDCVLLRTEGAGRPWVAILQRFQVDDEGRKAASFVWFNNEREIRNSKRKRTDCLPNEIYITSSVDVNPLDALTGKATVVSLSQFQTLYPNGKVPRRSKAFGKVFVCRRGLGTRTTTYSDEFVWEDKYRGFEDLAPLLDYITESTKLKKSPARTPSGKGRLSHTTPKKRPASQDLTPTRTPSKGSALEFTPLSTRQLPAYHSISSPFQLARNRLHVASVPSNLPCRDREFQEVSFHLEKAISTSTSNCIYISGTPGTGKTATVREVIRHLERQVEAGELDDFIFVEINGMKITNPHHSYAMLWQALKGDRVSPAQALDLLEREFSNPNPRRVPCVVLMDELDQLVTKNQGVMYNFFNWPSLRHSRLIVLAVANTMDLPERTLSNKISSRLGLTRIIFPGYSHGQLVEIIQSRLEGIPGGIVELDAIQFASRKIAAVSGDARRALDICRRAVELVETSSDKDRGKDDQQTLHKVTISTIKKAINEATSSPVQQHLRSLPLVPKLVLIAVLSRVRRSRNMELTMGDVTEELTSLLKACSGRLGEDVMDSLAHLVSDGYLDKNYTGVQPIPLAGVGMAAVELEIAGLILLEDHKPQRPSKVHLIVPEEEIKMAFQDDSEIQRLGVEI